MNEHLRDIYLMMHINNNCDDVTSIYNRGIIDT